MQRSSSIRVRLLFEDCNPLRPGSVGRRKCWFLLNIDACRRVTDVEYCIQKTFCLGRSSQIELLLDDFVLPPFEKSEIIQENDLIRVRLVCEGDQQQEVQVEEQQHSAEADHPSKRKKANMKAGPSKSSKDDVPRTSTAKRKKTRKERKVVDNEKMDGRLRNGEKGSKGMEESTEVGQTSRIDNPVQLSDASPSVENGTPKHSARAQKHTINSAKTTRDLDSISTFLASSSEDDDQTREIAKSKRLRKIAGRRKVQPSKSVTPSSSQVQSSLNPGTITAGVSGSKPTKSSARNSKCNGSGPLYSDSESNSTEKEADASKRKQSVKVSRSGLPNKKPTAGSVKTKRPAMTRTVDASTSSSASSMSSASSSSDSDGNPSLQLKQKQTMQSNVKPGAALPTQRVELPTPPVEEKALSSKKSAVVKKSKSKSSGGHVRFSSDSDSSESEAAVSTQPSSSERSPSSQPAQQINHEQRMSTVIPGARENNAMETEVPHNAGQDLMGERSEDCITHSALDDTNGVTTDGIQAKLLNIAGQKPKQQEKPKQLPKPRQPKKPKDYSSYPPLVGPPRSGDIVAYKILELSNSYTPEVSDYKEGEVINFNYSNSMIELRLSEVAMAAEPKRDGGKFEMETEENPAEQARPALVDRLVLVTLPSLIDPKLIT